MIQILSVIVYNWRRNEVVLLMEENKILGERLKSLRGKRTQEEVSKALGLSRARYSHYENNRVEPDAEILNKMADFYNVTTDYLFGRTDKKESDWDSKLPELTDKDEKDIAKDLEKMLNNLESKDGYAAFDGRDAEE